MKKKRKLKRGILIGIILVIIIFLGGLGTFWFLNKKKLEVTIVSSVQVKLNSEYNKLDNVKDLKNGTVLTDDEVIDTSKIGTVEVSIEIEDYWHKVKEYSYNVEVIDDEAPVITYEKEINVTVGSDIDLLDGVTATDNSLEDIEVSVSGEYDTTSEGSYTLYYVASDTSGNETKEEFTLNVEKKKEVSSSSNSSSKSSGVTTFTTSKGYSGYTKDGVTYIDGVLVANKTYGLPSTYGSGLTSETKAAFEKMQAAAKEDGIQIHIQSGYRSYQTQNTIYNNYVKRDGKVKADTYSARAGHSEHQTGLAFDVCSHDLDGQDACINDNFNNTEQAKWLSANAYKYGLILRYPEGKTDETGYKYESWHFRYVGVELATKLYNNGDWITLEDYYGITSEYDE